jgi:hypothetical protein
MRSDASRFTQYVLFDINHANEKLSKAVWSIGNVQQLYTAEEFDCVKQLMCESNELAELKQNIANIEAMLNKHGG